MNLPNGSQIRYDQYRIRCCCDCNSLLGRELEQRVQPLVESGYGTSAEHMIPKGESLSLESGPWLPFLWMACLFLKLHLKDQQLRLVRGPAAMSEKIGDLHKWGDLHHLHCLARTVFTKVVVEPQVLGSFFLLPARTDEGAGIYDLCSSSAGRALMVRLNEVCMIACFDDATAACQLLSSFLVPISGPISALQSRELLARVAYVNVSLKEHPQFHTEIDEGTSELKVSVTLPQRPEIDHDPRRLGALMEQLCGPLLSRMDRPPREEILVPLREGRWTFLVDDDNRFIEGSPC